MQYFVRKQGIIQDNIYLDIFLLENTIGDETVIATYQVATTIPTEFIQVGRFNYECE